MKVLVIYLSEYNGLSSSSKRVLGLVKGLLACDYSVTLLTTQFENRELEAETQGMLAHVQIIPMERSVFPGNGQSGRVRMKARAKQAVGRLYRYVRIFGHTQALAKRVRLEVLPGTAYDCVVSVSDPKTSHIALRTLLKQGLACKRVVEYWGDPLYGDITLKSIYPNAHIQSIERSMLSLADSIVYTSPFTVKRERELYPEFADKMKFVPSASVKGNVFREAGNERFTVGYYGAYHSDIRNIMPLYEVFAEKMCDDAQLRIIGDSDVALKPRDNILVLPRGNVERYEADSDVLVCLLNKAGTQIPGKLYYNASTSKAVLVILDGESISEMKRFLDGFHRFDVCRNSKADIAAAIKRIRSECRTWMPCERLLPEAVARQIVEDQDESVSDVFGDRDDAPVSHHPTPPIKP